MQDRLARLETNVTELERLAAVGDPGVRDQWALRYGLLESIQIVIDVACELAARRALGSPATYRACIDALAAARIIDADLALRLAAMVGLRNLLVHEYDEIDEKRLWSALEHVDDFRRFAAAVSRPG